MSTLKEIKNKIENDFLQHEAVHTWDTAQHQTAKKIIEILEKTDTEIGSFSDGFHTFDELYEFRKMYNAALFNEWAKQVTSMDKEWVKDENGKLKTKVTKVDVKYDVHKSMRHFDGEFCFGGDWFIVVAVLPEGQISNHYKMEDWDLFKVPVSEKAKYEFDGHTPTDVLNRLKAL
jgi:hypothetical protein